MKKQRPKNIKRNKLNLDKKKQNQPGVLVQDKTDPLKRDQFFMKW